MGAAASVSSPVGKAAAQAAVGAERFDEAKWAALPKDRDGRVLASAWNAAVVDAELQQALDAELELAADSAALFRRHEAGL